MSKDIVRFYETGRRKLIHASVSAEQAREWCSSPLTKKAGKYFDGFDNAGRQCPDQSPMYTNYFAPNEDYH